MSKNTFTKVVGLGLFEINLTLTLSEEEASHFKIPQLSTLTSLEDCKSFLTELTEEAHDTQNEDKKVKKISIFDFFVLSTSNSAINTLLYINKSFKNKTFIEYLTLSEPVFKEEDKFLYDVIKTVTEQNYLFVLENRIIKAPSKYNFIFNIGKDQKIFQLESAGADIDPKKQFNKKELYHKLNYEFDDTNYFFGDLNDFFKMSKYNLDMNQIAKLLKTLITKHKKMQIVLNFPDIIQNVSIINDSTLQIISEIILYTDIFIFDKREALNLFSLFDKISTEGEASSKNIEEFKKNIEIIFIRDVKKLRSGSPKIGLFLDELKKFTIIEQQPRSDIVLFHSDFELDIIPSNITKAAEEEYKRLTAVNYNMLKCVFMGGFFSRLFHGKSFNTCFKAGNEAAKRILELFKLNFELPSDPNFYLISIKKPVTKPRTKKELIAKKEKERHFFLDCINVQNSKLKNYNPLYDQNLESFFSSKFILKHLKKLGFVDKKGNILQDPDTKHSGVGNNGKFLRSIELEKKRLMNLRENHQMMKMQLKQIMESDLKNLNYTNFEQLEKLLKLENFNLIANKKVAQKSDPEFMDTYSKPEDLYAKSLIARKNKNMPKINSKVNNIKSIKPISGESYKQLLENYETKLNPIELKELPKLELSENEKKLKSEEIIIIEKEVQINP